ncbi:signal recognition particle-docking protein FtsY [Breznakiellaceae bacterium SP9]
MKFTEKIKSFFGLHKAVSPEFYDELDDLLIEGDFGAQAALKTGEALRAVCKKEKISDTAEVRKRLAVILEGVLTSAAPQEETAVLPEGLCIILLLGVNGVGKTTSAAKLAAYYRTQQKRKPILAAADTFRAAAIDQLKIHGERLGLRVVAHKHGGDPAAVVYDAVEAAQAGGGDLIIADTAGRMHTKNALVEELKKIDRVVASKAAGAAYRKYLVLDSTTGRNAFAQAEIFHSAVHLDGFILTKCDSSARGGILFSLAHDLHLSAVFLCNGEQYEDLHPFEASAYARDFAGLV